LKRLFIFFLLILNFSGYVSAQNAADTVQTPVIDTLLKNDSLFSVDSLPKVPIVGTLPYKKIIIDSSLFNATHIYSFPTENWQLIPGFTSYAAKTAKAQTTFAGKIRTITGKELLFYALVALFIFFAVLRRAFAKYFNDLFRLFFKTTLKQRQIREQLMQTPLPSLLLNVFFILSGGFYLAILLQHYAVNPVGNFWLLFLYCGMGLSVAYFIKFAGLKICGWLFNMDEAANSYIFIVFIVNKMIGILLLPFLLVLAFSLDSIHSAGLTLSWCLIGGLLVYRFILTYGAIHNQVKVNLFHFFLYLCAFEIAPLLLVYKALLIFFNQTA
jgi:hypothetical protein